MPDRDIFLLRVIGFMFFDKAILKPATVRIMTSPFSCSAASSGLPRVFQMSKPSSKWEPSSPGLELLCVSRRKFANLDLLRIRHFEKFDFRSDTWNISDRNRAMGLVDFLYQPSQELNGRVINIWKISRYPGMYRFYSHTHTQSEFKCGMPDKSCIIAPLRRKRRVWIRECGSFSGLAVRPAVVDDGRARTERNSGCGCVYSAFQKWKLEDEISSWRCESSIAQ